MSVEPSLDGVLDFYPGVSTLGGVHEDLIASLIAARNAVATREWDAAQIAGLRCMGLGGAASHLTAVYAKGERGRISAQFEYMDLSFAKTSSDSFGGPFRLA